MPFSTLPARHAAVTPQWLSSPSARSSFVAALVLMSTLAPAVSAIDEESLRVSKDPTETEIILTWSDSSAGLYCVEGEAVTFPPTPPIDLPVIVQADGTAAAGPPFLHERRLDRGPDSLVFHQVVDAIDGNCGACAPSSTLTCGATLTGSTAGDEATPLNSTYAACGVLDATGPETVYAVTADADETLTAELTGASGDLTLVVLEELGGGCAGDPCVASGVTASWSATAGMTYLVVVEGIAGSTGDYTLSLACGGGTATCSPEGAIACGETVSSTTIGAGPSAIDSWSACAGAPDASGPEVVREVTITTDGMHRAVLTNASADLDLYALRDDGAGCDASSCVAFGDDAVVFDAVSGETWLIVVDGRGGASSDFDLTLECPVEVDCTVGPEIACGGTLDGTTDALGVASARDEYAGCGLTDFTGPEIFHPFSVVEAQLVTISLTAAADMALVVLEDSGADCSTATCVASAGGTVELFAMPGVSYLIGVDGRAGAAGAYTLDVACGPVPQCDPHDTLICGEGDFDSNLTPIVTDINDAYPCNDGIDYSGPEVTYRFVAPRDGTAQVVLTSTNDFDVFVLEDVGAGCDPSGCIAFGRGAVDFSIVGGTTYYFVVDGVAGAMGNFDLDFTCTLPPSVCEVVDTIECGVENGYDTAAPMATDAIDEYPGCGLTDMTGPEVAFQFSVAAETAVTASLGGAMEGDLDIVVLEEVGAGCDPASCIASGDLQASFVAQPGVLYYLVVDGRAGIDSPFSIFLECEPAPGECSPVQELACGETVSGNNGGMGSSDVTDRYGDCPSCRSCAFDGPEIAYEWTATSDGTMEATLTNFTDFMGVVIIEDDGSGACAASNCVGAGFSSASAPVSAGTRYFIVVEGAEGNVSDYDLTVTCS